MNSTGARALIDVLLEQGVDTVFGYPGSAVLDIYDELYKCDKIRHILTCHEQAAAHAADGYARATGRTGSRYCNLGTRCHQSRDGNCRGIHGFEPRCCDNWERQDLAARQRLVSGGRYRGRTMPVTKYSFIASGERGVAQDVREAFSIAQSGRKGPVLVDIPADIAAQSEEYDARRRASPPRQKSRRRQSSNARRR